ncbi:putative bifunctional diguanylate cyclase/phosphodiesterase [Echinimonas agarilytica]|uniref:EAL domain-containing protein n=1 Tax=Echinimonas agarilytica TaxID=1215918 RepID=A0AA42B6J9_9GAMM|nr:EAL domain-containing protein [Echinimonas agarilytica]MCM2678847.1 EAL domain-containing protein [Echinimonas agarilytica]
MPLSRRALIALLPPLLIAFFGIALLFFQQRKDAIQDLERARAEYALANISASVQQSQDHLIGVEQALLQSTVFVSFIQNTQEQIWSLASQRASEHIVKMMSSNEDMYYALVVLDSEHNTNVMVETSMDPFVEHLTEERMLFKRFADSSMERDVFLYSTKGEYRMIALSRIDPLSLRAPLPSQNEDSVIVAQVLSSYMINQAIHNVIERYGHEALAFDRQPELAIENPGMILSQPLIDGHHLNLFISSALLTDEMLVVMRNVMFLFAGVMLVTLMITSLLLRIAVVAPIQALEKAIRSDKLDTLRMSKADDVSELYSLKHAFIRMFRKLKQAHAEANELALTDSLTKLPNRLSFAQQVQAGLTYADSNQLTATLLFIDLDNFKFVNDRFGHRVGDDLLIKFSKQLSLIVDRYEHKLAMPSMIRIARLAGDEFAIMVVSASENWHAKGFANHIIELFSGGFKLDHLNLPVRASIGIATYPQDALDAGTLLSNADAAMYQAKQNGKNQYQLFSKKMADSLQRRKDLENALRSESLLGELSLRYMPVFSGDDLSTVVGAEALLRWDSKKLGAVMPSEFIPIAEACGQYGIIDRWVIKNCFSSLPDLIGQFGNNFVLSVNVSAAELKDNGFTEFLRPQVDQYRKYLKNIELEVTETFHLEWNQVSAQVMKDWSNLGISLAIDDFGTGYTSIKQLNSFPINTLKVDKSFTDEIELETVRILMDSLIRAAEALKLNVTVEGIETETQLKLVQQLGNHRLQGYLFCPPIPLEQLLLSYQSCSLNSRAPD